MKLISSAHEDQEATLKEALYKGFASPGALYLPTELPQIPRTLYDQPHKIAEKLIGFEIHFSAPLPVRKFNEPLALCELFHGPTLSFKDFGAEGMAQIVRQLRAPHETLTLLVATTGDTGSAIGTAFHNVEGTRVIILYPKGEVTPSQEKQITTIGDNVTALEIEGSFDDCQCLLQQALEDPDLSQPLTTGNSINIARLIPQILYFFKAYAQLETEEEIILSIPCGNFGHLVSAILAKRMGLPITKFIAATNINDEVPQFLKTGVYAPHESWHTLAISMDVGHPSNFARLQALYHHSLTEMRQDLIGISISDATIRTTIKRFYEEHAYILDPHTAVAYAALRESGLSQPALFFATAHPAKFAETIEPLIGTKIDVPSQLATAYSREKRSHLLPASYSALKTFLQR